MCPVAGLRPCLLGKKNIEVSKFRTFDFAQTDRPPCTCLYSAKKNPSFEVQYYQSQAQRHHKHRWSRVSMQERFYHFRRFLLPPGQSNKAVNHVNDVSIDWVSRGSSLHVFDSPLYLLPFEQACGSPRRCWHSERRIQSIRAAKCVRLYRKLPLTEAKGKKTIHYEDQPELHKVAERLYGLTYRSQQSKNDLDSLLKMLEILK